jgi:hypothetical protein
MSRPCSAASVNPRGISFPGVLTPSRPFSLNKTADQAASPTSKKRKRDVAAQSLTTDNLLVAPVVLQVRAILRDPGRAETDLYLAASRTVDREAASSAPVDVVAPRQPPAFSPRPQPAAW